MKHQYAYLPGELKQMTEEADQEGFTRGIFWGIVIGVIAGAAVAMGTVTLWARLVI